MKTKILSIGLAVLFLTAAFTFLQKEVKVDTNSSQIAWVGKKVTGQHNGTVNIKEGALEMEDGQVTGGSFTIDMTTIDSRYRFQKDFDFYVHSQNPVGKANIEGLLNGYLKQRII